MEDVDFDDGGNHEGAANAQEAREETKFNADDGGYFSWLAGEGRQYKEPHRPCNWLGGDVTPFPLNTTFKPPPPVSDATRTEIYQQFMTNPTRHNMREVAALHGMSLARVDAILRLKGLEEHWKKGKQLQTGFQVGMEYILGVTEHKKTATSVAQQVTLSEDTISADLQHDDERWDLRARERYQRLFWEPTAEGQDPLIPDILDETQSRGSAAKRRFRYRKSQVVERPGRPEMRFVDVGKQWVDPKEAKQRARAAAHRAEQRSRKQQRKHEAIAASKLPVTRAHIS
ncbi:mitochondrial regulator protein-domain-containing protein [Phanerochaete sordida]|uniref:Mitochondrial regulator protein-domain-containing protein n=1 Tax=Phanerochaete sordida TaxID=48140 RepID=A0A9P3L8L0_9APHY|nr:mitochondrial regulator protein-domain-containing protein [Phanerochaete sordida]